MVGCLHGDSDITDFVVDGVLRKGKRFVGVDDLPIPLVRLEIVGAVSSDEPPQTLAHIQDTELGPQIHQTVRSGGAGQSHNTFYLRANLQHCREPLCIVVFEGGQLINHDHVKVKDDAAFLNKPLDILAVDDVNISFPHECCTALWFSADSHGAAEVLKVIPLMNLSCPCVPCHS